MDRINSPYNSKQLTNVAAGQDRTSADALLCALLELLLSFFINWANNAVKADNLLFELLLDVKYWK